MAVVQRPCVLLIEDDPLVVDLVTELLERDGYQVVAEGLGADGLARSRSLDPTMVILDVRLPDLDGLSVCREIRRFSQTPILFLSGCAEDTDRIVGLEVGADDYLTKPFNPRELLARVRALRRRWEQWRTPNPSLSEPASPGPPERYLTLSGLQLDLKGYTAALDGVPLPLTTLEFNLVRFLAEHAGQVKTRQSILDHVWGVDYVGDERTVDAHIRNLRAKLRQFSPTEYILSVRGVGYKFAG